MTWITDSLRSAIAAVNPFQRGGYNQGQTLQGMFSSQLAIAAYLSSGMLRKVINIPAADRVREWRDWQADEADITLLEDEEKRLNLLAKVKFAEVLRGLGGGALVLVTAGDHSKPLDSDTITKDALVAINVASRWQIRAADFVKDLASPDYGMPTVFKIEGAGTGKATEIHPSRVICFRGDPLPADGTVSDEEAFWGDSRLLRVLAEVNKSDNASLWFSQLVRKAKLLRFGISNLTDYETDDLNKRVALIAEGENSLNATVYNLPTKDGAGNEAGGEKIEDYQVKWDGIPAVQDMFDQRVAAVSDIPFTRLMGRSPAGMNATGQHDMDNWHSAVASGQKLETRPCLEALDPILMRSAGVDPAKVTWKFAPLSTPTEAEEATTFSTTMIAVTALQATQAIPDVAFTKAVQNLLSEREWLPGIDQALAEIPEAERFGLNQPDAELDANGDPVDPSAIQSKGGDPVSAGAGGDESVPARRRAANDARFTDATPRTLYVRRDVVNVGDIQKWAKTQGFTDIVPDLHVTIAYSTTPVDWMKVGTSWSSKLEIGAGGPRLVEGLGPDGKYGALLFTADELVWRNQAIRDAGASWSWPDYQPHISIQIGGAIDLSKVQPYTGEIVLGPEIFEEVRTGDD